MVRAEFPSLAGNWAGYRTEFCRVLQSEGTPIPADGPPHFSIFPAHSSFSGPRRLRSIDPEPPGAGLLRADLPDALHRLRARRPFDGAGAAARNHRRAWRPGGADALHELRANGRRRHDLDPWPTRAGD